MKPSTGVLVCFFFSVKLVCESRHSALSHTTEPTLDLNVSHYIFCETDSKKKLLFFSLRGREGLTSHTKTLKESFIALFFSSRDLLDVNVQSFWIREMLETFLWVCHPLITAAAAAAVQLLSPPSASAQSLLTNFSPSQDFASPTFAMQLYFLKTVCSHWAPEIQLCFEGNVWWCVCVFFFLNKWGDFFSSDD